MKQLSLLLISAVIVGSGVSAFATPITFTGTGTGANANLAAAAIFDVSGSDLIITLRNTGADALVPADILLALFFDLAGSPVLTRDDAALGAGGVLLNGAVAANVPHEWAYRGALSGAPGGADYGVSGAGFDLFGKFDLFLPRLPSSAAPNGMGYGLVSGIGSGANSPLLTNPLLDDTIVFTLGGFTGTLDEISNVSFQYGTSLCEPNIPGVPNDPPGTHDAPVPEPATLSLLSLGLVGLALRRTRKLG